jgi:translation initiation factor IF-2
LSCFSCWTNIKEEITGTAEVRELFKISKVGTIAGCMVVSGKILRNGKIRIIRDSVVIFDGELATLKRFKDDVKEVKSGTECGIGVLNYTDVQPGDQIEVFERIERARSL